MPPAIQKKSCSNNEKYKYTGKEMSPLGLGIASEPENIGKQHMGRDGKNWIVVSKNNNKVWMRAPEPHLVKEQPKLEKSFKPISSSNEAGPSGTVHGDTESDFSSSDDDELPSIPILKINDIENDDDEEITPRPTESPHSIAGSPKDIREQPKRMSFYSSEKHESEDEDEEVEEEKPKPKHNKTEEAVSESDEEEEKPKHKKKVEVVSESEEEEEKPKKKIEEKPKPKKVEKKPKPKKKVEVSESEEEEEEKPKPKPKKKVEVVSESDEEEEKPKPKSKATEDEEVHVVAKRKSHDVKASVYDAGYTKVEDGITYIVKESANNVKKWVKQTQPKSHPQSTGKKRGPTAYNLFIGKQLTELRETVPGLPTTEYMKLALQTWNNMTPDEKEAIKK